MKKIIRLTESDLARIVKKVLNEQSSTNCDRDWQKILYKFKTDEEREKVFCNDEKRNKEFKDAVNKKQLDANNEACLRTKTVQWCRGKGKTIEESTFNRLVKNILKETSGGEDCWDILTDEKISVPQSCREKGNTQCKKDLQTLLNKINDNPKQREAVNKCMECYRDKFINVVADSPIFKK